MKIKIKILLLLSLFYYENIFAHTSRITSEKLDYNEQLLKDVQYLLSSEETIDYDDPKLHEILNKYDFLLFKAYKAFISLEKSDKTGKDLIKAKKILLNLYKSAGLSTLHEKDYKPTKENIYYMFFRILSNGSIDKNIAEKLPGEREKNWEKGYKFIKIPKWLVIKYPEVVIQTNGVYTLTVNTSDNVKSIKSFNKFLSALNDVVGGYYSPVIGYFEFGSYYNTKHFIDIISFNPLNQLKFDAYNKNKCIKTIPERFPHLKRWLNHSKENKIKYKNLVFYYKKAVRDLKIYYESKYYLKQYSHLVEDILHQYVCENTKDYDRDFYDYEV